MNIEKSISEYTRSCKSLPGGVNSPVRAFESVNCNPVFISHAKGSKITDIDGNTYIDYVASWGPLLAGHANDMIIEAVIKAAEKGTSYGAPTIQESVMAEMIIDMVPSVEMVRMVCSGTEATMSAIRLARGFTGKSKIIKFAGCYHGHGDSFLIKAGSGAITLGLPDSPGVTEGTAKDTLIAEYNNIHSVENLFHEHGKSIAAIIVEPVAGNIGVVLPEENFLKELREMASKNDCLLIFDEVITGFRIGKGGAQEYYNVIPDITTLGKIIGGGLPVGAYGGRKEIMEMLAPSGPVYQAGTLSGNPLAMAAGIAMLKFINERPSLYSELDTKAAKLEAGIKLNLQKTGVKGVVNRLGSMMTLFFNDLEKIESFDDVMRSDRQKYAAYFRLCLESGIYIAPSQFEAGFVSSAHSDQDIDRTVEANFVALSKLK